jgi:hypothetical protein
MPTRLVVTTAGADSLAVAVKPLEYLAARSAAASPEACWGGSA